MRRYLKPSALLGSFAALIIAWAIGPSAALAQEPGLHSSTFLGGFNTRVIDVAVDARGATYVTGFTADAQFPTTPGAFMEERTGFVSDAFVTKLSPDGTTLEYSTYVGGSSFDQGTGIAIDGQGNAYVTGNTGSTDFPTTAGSFDTTKDPQSRDAFVVKLAGDGSHLEYGAYLGGTSGDRSDVFDGGDFGEAIAVDEQGAAYVTGATQAADFPTTPGALHRTADGTIAQNAFVTKVSPAGSAMAYSTYLPGSSHDAAFGIAVDQGGHAYVTGHTSSADFATTPGAYATQVGGSADVFVAKLSPDGSGLAYSTYIGGVSSEVGAEIDVDRFGSAYVTGRTLIHESWGGNAYPTTPGAYDTTPDVTGNAFNSDMFVTKLAPDGSALAYSTALGGAGDDRASGIAVDPQGRAHVTGVTDDWQFPVTADAFDTTYNGGFDVVVARFSADGAQLAYSTFLGGTANDGDDFNDHALAVDPSGLVHVGAATKSPNYPTTPGAYQTAFTAGSGYGAFVSRLALPSEPAEECKGIGSGTITAADGDSTRFAGNVSLRNGQSRGNLRYRDHGPAQAFFARSISMSTVVCDRGRVTAFGDAVVGRSETPISYRVEMVDGGPHGRDDAYRIQLANGYDSGLQALDTGSIRIR